MVSQKFGFELFDEPVIDNRFLKDYYREMKRWSFTLQLEFLIRRVEHHELIHKVPKSCIQDRTLYEDPEIFAKYLHGLGNMTDQELDLYFEYFQRLTKTIAHPQKVICFDVPSVDVLLARIRTRGREEEKGIQQAFLRGLNGYYATFPMVLSGKYGIDVLTLDVSLRSMGKIRQSFIGNLIPSVISWTLGVWLMFHYGLLGMNFGLLFTYVVVLIVLGTFYRRAGHTPETQPATATASA